MLKLGTVILSWHQTQRNLLKWRFRNKQTRTNIKTRTRRNGEVNLKPCDKRRCIGKSVSNKFPLCLILVCLGKFPFNLDFYVFIAWCGWLVLFVWCSARVSWVKLSMLCFLGYVARVFSVWCSACVSCVMLCFCILRDILHVFSVWCSLEIPV